MWMSKDGQGTKWRRVAENFNRLSRVHERNWETTDGRAIVNVSSRSLNTHDGTYQILKIKVGEGGMRSTERPSS